MSLHGYHRNKFQNLQNIIVYIKPDNCLSGIVEVGYCQPWYNDNKIYYSDTITKHTLLPHKKYFGMTISIKVCRR